MDFENFSPSGFRQSKAGEMYISGGHPDSKKMAFSILAGAAALTIVIAIVIVFSTMSPFSSIKTDSNETSGIFSPSQEKEVKTSDEARENLAEDYVAEEVAQIVETISEEELEDGKRARVSRGDEIDFEYDGVIYKIFIDLIGGEIMDITIQSDTITSTLKLDTPKKFDLDDDSYYDLELELKEIIGAEAILELYGIHEKYKEVSIEIVDEDNETVIVVVEEEETEEDSTGLEIITTETIPYSCTEQGLYVDYVYLEVSMRGDSILSEERYSRTYDDFCAQDIRSYFHYYCNGVNYQREEVICESEYDDCISARCEQVRFDYNLGKSGSPEEFRSDSNECQISIGDTIFWASTTEEKCSDILVASKIYGKTDFLEFLDYKGLDDSLIGDYFYVPTTLEITYITSENDIEDFSELAGKVISDSCESIEFLDRNLYCFNPAGSKDQNLDFIKEILDFFDETSTTYKSNFISKSTSAYIENKVSTYTDASDTSLITDSGCSSYVNYKNNNLYFCSSAISAGTGDTNKALILKDLFFDFLEELSGYETEECFEIKINESYIITYYGDYDGETEDEDKPSWDGVCPCTCSGSGCYTAVCDGCRAHDKLIESYSYQNYLNPDTLTWEKINFLYEMSTKTGFSTTERRKFWNDAATLKGQITCDEGFYDETFSVSLSDIINPEVLPDEKYDIPSYP